MANYVLVHTKVTKPKNYYIGNTSFDFLGYKGHAFGADIKRAVIFENKKDAMSAAKRIGDCKPEAIKLKKECYRIKSFNFDSAVKRYNGIMFDLALEHMTIGTKFSEDTDDFGIAEMVSECEYWLGTYYESGHLRGDMRFSNDPEERKQWRSEKGKLERFINTYSKYI